MKKGITLQILKILKDQVVDTGFLWEAIILSGYGASFGQIQKKKEELEMKRLDRIEKQKEMEKFYSILSQLKKQGFIKKSKNGWISTQKGKIKFLKSSKRLNVQKYDIKKEQSTKIIIFDIPEKERAKRNWMRFTLQKLKFEILQKSVWIGKNKLPEEFLEDLMELEIINYVQIFIISKTGTLVNRLKNVDKKTN